MYVFIVFFRYKFMRNYRYGGRFSDIKGLNLAWACSKLLFEARAEVFGVRIAD